MVDYRIVDTNAQSSHWLFPEGEQLFLDTIRLPYKQDEKRDTAIDTDANWSTPVKITEGVTSVLESTADGTHVARISLPSGELPRDQVIRTRE
ncbi:hypothetical protein OS189_10940 [Sulfitobacter sp. F26169L]|uniref:hypothetical protein n=1 Tax=Sulfitobacter sp. F26169L TaxID=2996015 RepID=UPI002260A95A|nr:hypothetical protein [Sulfitobacter sp. F26169L]MCX7566856.1 hypothetical protein [Sulfitobacter sp. F26169L]